MGKVKEIHLVTLRYHPNGWLLHAIFGKVSFLNPSQGISNYLYTPKVRGLEIKNMIVLKVGIVRDIRGSFKGSMIRCL